MDARRGIGFLLVLGVIAIGESSDGSPTAPRYGSFRAARDSVRAMVRRALGAWADSARWRLDRSLAGPALRMTLETHVGDAPGNLDIERALERAGWVRDGVSDADGPDGTRFGMECREARCVIEASWDGGDDADSTYVPVPGERVELVCVPRPVRDPRPPRR